MSDFHLDDPRLTAYVLGELDEIEIAQLEAWLAKTPEAQAHVEGLRLLTEQVFTSLQAEAEQELPVRSEIEKTLQHVMSRSPIAEAASAPAKVSVEKPAMPAKSCKAQGNPSVLVAVISVAALLLAVTFSLRSPDPDDYRSSLASSKDHLPTVTFENRSVDALASSVGESIISENNDMTLALTDNSRFDSQLHLFGAAPDSNQPVQLGLSDGDVSGNGAGLPYGRAAGLKSFTARNTNDFDVNGDGPIVVDSRHQPSQPMEMSDKFTPYIVSGTAQTQGVPHSGVTGSNADGGQAASVATTPQPHYPYTNPQVPLGWRKQSLEWKDGHWSLQLNQSGAQSSQNGQAGPATKPQAMPFYSGHRFQFVDDFGLPQQSGPQQRGVANTSKPQAGDGGQPADNLGLTQRAVSNREHSSPAAKQPSQAVDGTQPASRPGLYFDKLNSMDGINPQVVAEGEMRMQAIRAAESESKAANASGSNESQAKLARAVTNFNSLMDQKRFEEANAVAKEVKGLAPQDPVAVTMELKSMFAIRNSQMDEAKSGKESNFYHTLQEVESSLANNPVANKENLDVDPKNWQSLEKHRMQIAPQAADGQSGSGVRILSTQLSTVNQPVPAIQSGEEAVALGGTVVSGRQINETDNSVGFRYVAPAASSQEGLELAATSGKRMESLRRKAYPYFTHRGPADFFGEASIQKIASNESYAPIKENEFLAAKESPYSTFSIDVDTGAYANIRRMLHNNIMPPPNAVRLEELVNSFDYTYEQPNEEHPVAITLNGMPCPWDASHDLVRVGIKARDINAKDRPPTSLVFLIDVSGSMKDANKLPLAQSALRLLVNELDEGDRIAIVTYSSNARVVLESTTEKETILAKIDELTAGGSTNGSDGLRMAYDVATKNLIEEGANRVIVCTDGDFNVGPSSDNAMFELIEQKLKSGVFLSVLGFGTGNLKDSKLEGIANRGNGHYSYIDQLEEANRVLVEHLTGTLYTVAKDVKLQVEFNPGYVESYRLIGYENRALADRDFNNDQVDAGEMGAGHTVTALYEIVPVEKREVAPEGVDALRYGKKPVEDPATEPVEEVKDVDEVLFVKLRYKQPQSDESVKLEVPLSREALNEANPDTSWASNVASFGMLLRESKFKGNATWDELVKRTQSQLDKGDVHEQRLEFLDLVLRARGLWRRANGLHPEMPPEYTSLEAREKAQCKKYQDLLDKILRPDDWHAYGSFFEFGHRRGDGFEGAEGLPDGYWVYVYPHWYVWGGAEQGSEGAGVQGR